MTIIWKDTTLKLHGKRHKGDRYYFRWHYGKQRVVQISREYVDKPTEAQESAREAFTELRREVARQLRDAELRARWEARFKKDNEGYKMLHTYVYAMMKRGERVACRDAIYCVSVSETKSIADKNIETQYMASLYLSGKVRGEVCYSRRNSARVMAVAMATLSDSLVGASAGYEGMRMARLIQARMTGEMPLPSLPMMIMPCLGRGCA